MDISSLTDPNALIAYGLGCASGYGFALGSIIPGLKERIADYSNKIEELTERVISLEEEIKNELRKQIT